jgi:hypothetical protein
MLEGLEWLAVVVEVGGGAGVTSVFLVGAGWEVVAAGLAATFPWVGLAGPLVALADPFTEALGIGLLPADVALGDASDFFLATAAIEYFRVHGDEEESCTNGK